MRAFLRLGLLLVLANVASYSQIFLSVTQGEVTSGLTNGGALTVTAPALSQPVDFMVSVTYAGPGVLRFSGAPRLAGSSDFRNGSSTPADTTLTSGQSVAVPVRFLASTAGIASAQLSWAYSETLVETQVARTGAIVVRMNGLAPSIDLGYSFSLDGNFNLLPMTDGVLPFPPTPINSNTSAEMTLLNRGTGPVEIASIAVTGGAFTMTNRSLLPATLGTGTALRFQVRFQPRTNGSQQGVLTVRYGNGQTHQVTLRGEAIASYLQYQFQTGTDAPAAIAPNSLVSMPATPVGQRASATIQFTNTSPFDISIPSIAVSGTGWAIADLPFTPLTMSPDSSQFFTVSFAPTQPGVALGRLRIGSDTFELRGEAQGSQLQYRYFVSDREVPLSAGGTITFPNSTIEETSNIIVSVTNNGTSAASILTVSVPGATGSGFSVAGFPPLPFSLAPRETFRFNLRFKPVTTGATTGTLRINTDQFTLYGAADQLPDFPEFTIQGPQTTQAFEQPRIALVLSKAYPVSVRGTLALAVESDGYAVDPSTQFSTGGRNVTFTIPAGSLRATFSNGIQEIRFQTGSVAGNFLITAAFSTTAGTPITTDSTRALRIGFSQTAPRLVSGGVSGRSPNSLSLELIGITTTRSLTKLTVRVKPRAGYQIANAEYTQDLSGPSMLWFYSMASMGYGGQFVATLPLQLSSSGNGTPGTDLVQAIESITVTFQNERGSSDPMTVLVQ